MADLDGAGGAKTLVIDLVPGVPITIENFGSFGTGGAPADPGELDTLHFIGHDVTAADMTMVQDGPDVVITFDADPNATPVTIKNTTIEQLGNIAGVGNFRFGDEAAPSDSLDVWGAAENGDRVHHAGTVTFLNDLDNDVRHNPDGPAQ